MDKNQYERYKIIDRILRSTPDGLPLDMLLERVNASLSDEKQIRRRQLQYDIDELREYYHAPIPRKQGLRRVRYDDLSYSIVTHEIESSLRSMAEQLQGIDNNPRLQWLQNLLLMLHDTYSANPMAIEAIDFGDNLEYESSRRVHEFFTAIINKRVLEVTYSSGFGPSRKYVIHPYFIRQYNNRWFLFGWCEAAVWSDHKIMNLALDRIGEAKEKGVPYREITVDELKTFKEDYFGDIVGVSRSNEAPSHLVIRFEFNTEDDAHNKAARKDYYYLKTKPFFPYMSFPSEESIKENGYADVKMDIIPNKELEALLLRYADTARILEPDDFRDVMKKRIERIYERQK